MTADLTFPSKLFIGNTHSELFFIFSLSTMEGNAMSFHYFIDVYKLL